MARAERAQLGVARAARVLLLLALLLLVQPPEVRRAPARELGVARRAPLAARRRRRDARRGARGERAADDDAEARALGDGREQRAQLLDDVRGSERERSARGVNVLSLTCSTTCATDAGKQPALSFEKMSCDDAWSYACTRTCAGF